jgi:hypothetical protein
VRLQRLLAAIFKPNKTAKISLQKNHNRAKTSVQLFNKDRAQNVTPIQNPQPVVRVMPNEGREILPNQLSRSSS